ncbi:hypothetical protein SAMN02910289_00395 [Lachnospiraceae bacterium RM5]|nr:hypothetical protein SAMN02910289_00395 [Lachnospiraceae bacterium RM5]
MVEYIAKKAFWNLNMPGCDEHYLVHRIWDDPAYVPEYYPKFGFKTANQYGITMPDGSNFDAFMGYELQENGLSAHKGKFYEPDSLDCDIHDESYMKQVEELNAIWSWRYKQNENAGCI